jgi:hypothetical protein
MPSGTTRRGIVQKVRYMQAAREWRKLEGSLYSLTREYFGLPKQVKNSIVLLKLCSLVEDFGLQA